MRFRNGLLIKPKAVLQTGQVIFTDGRFDVMPNQVDCEAYGYTYNAATRTCQAYSYSTKIEDSIRNESNFIKGDRNSTETGTRNTLIVGQNNIAKGDNRDSIIIGDNNEIGNGVENVAMFGNFGLAQREGEFIIGGGSFNGKGAGYGQSSIISLSGNTTDATQTNLKVNVSNTDTVIARASTTSFQGFEGYVIGVRTGGSHGSGAANDRVFIKVSGIVYLKAVNQTSTSLGKSGTTTGWNAEVVFSGTNDMHFSVVGHANMSIAWSCTLNLYETKV